MSAVSATSLPPSIADYIAQLDATDRRALELVASLSETQANWHPRAGAAWSIAQIFEHLANTTRTYLVPMEFVAPRARSGHRPLQPAGWFSRYFLKKAEPPVSLKVKAPRKIQPKLNLSLKVAVLRFHESNDEVRRFVLANADHDLCGIRFNNPFIPGIRFTVATGLLAITAHTRRHLWQIEQIMKDPAFPR